MKLFLAIVCVVFTGVMNAQVKTYPYTQSFEDGFVYGYKTNFLPNWWANYMVPDTMGQYDAFAHSGSHCLYMKPEGEEFRAMVQVKLDLSNAANTYAEFWVASRKNGSAEDEKRARLNAAVSVDGGVTFPYVAGVGPHEGFLNADTEFEKFLFVFPPATNNQSDVVLRFIGRSGGGPHLPAIVLIDDVFISQGETDIFAPYIMGGELLITETRSLKIPFSEPLLSSSATLPSNYKFTWPVHEDGTVLVGEGPLPSVEQIQASSDGYSLTLTLDPPLSIGETYMLEMSNIEDLNGNVADVLTVDAIVFNEPVPGSLVISEVLFADPSSVYPKGRLQYVELFNPTKEVVPLGGLRIKGSISAHDLPNVKLKPGEFWVATRNAASYLATFGKEAWEWKGSWIEYESDHEETPEPQTLYIQTTNRHGGKLVDSIGFDFGNPAWASLNRKGFSVELCDPGAADPHDPQNWSLANDSEPYFYLAEGVEYMIHATPGDGCRSADEVKKYCTYTQWFYGDEKSKSCSSDDGGVSSLSIMRTVLPEGKQQVFGSTSTNRYFILKGTDVTNGSVFTMLPGGKGFEPLPGEGGSTYGSVNTWDRVPISTKRHSYGRIENELLSQTITLFFNMGWNTRKTGIDKFNLSTLQLKSFMRAIPSSGCRFSGYSRFGNLAIISPRLISFLKSEYPAGANVESLFDLANRMLGADPELVKTNRRWKPTYKGVTPLEITFAIAAVNNLFDRCGTYDPNPDRCTISLAESSPETIEELSVALTADVIEAYPNPFYDKVTIAFAATEDNWAELNIYSPDGRLVATLFNGQVNANEVNLVEFVPVRNAAFFIYRLSVGGITKSGRLLPMK